MLDVEARDKKGYTRDTRERSCIEVGSHQNGSSLWGIVDDEGDKTMVEVHARLGHGGGKEREEESVGRWDRGLGFPL